MVREDEMRAKDVMTRCVISAEPEMPVPNAVARMITHQVSGMPVINAQGELVGMVTEGDFLHRPETQTQAPRRRWLELLLGPGRVAEQYARTHGRTVGDVMSSKVVTAREETPVSEIVRLMEEHRIKRIPVVDANERLVGIVSRADLMAALAESLSKGTEREESDAWIRRRVLAEMRRQAWCPVQSVTVSVKGGVVALEGAIFDVRQRHALRVLAANIDGVKRVEDHLIWIDAMSGLIVESGNEPAAATQSTDGMTSHPSMCDSQRLITRLGQ
jgi:CBS domain-containing protein